MPICLANQQLPSNQRANTNFLRPYKGYSSIRQRRNGAFMNYNSVQMYLNKRRGDVKYSVSYTLAKARGFGSTRTHSPPRRSIGAAARQSA